MTVLNEAVTYTPEGALEIALALIERKGIWVGDKKELLNFVITLKEPTTKGPSHDEIVEMLDEWHGDDHYDITTQWTFPYETREGLTGEIRDSEDAGEYFDRLIDTSMGNQLESMVEKIEKWGRNNRTCAQVFQVERDLNAMFPPCLMTLQAFYRGEEIHLSAYFRSHTVAKSYYGDIVALGRLQEWLADTVDVEAGVGSLVVHSGSLHVRKENDEDELADKMRDLWA